jgi:hypothetical protein
MDLDVYADDVVPVPLTSAALDRDSMSGSFRTKMQMSPFRAAVEIKSNAVDPRRAVREQFSFAHRRGVLAWLRDFLTRH